MLEIGLFGEPRFTFEGRPHAFSAPPKALPLLAYLLLRRNAAVPRETIAGTLWPDDDDETARANLRRHIHYIRSALPEGEWIVADRRSVQWNPAGSWRVDVADFEQQSKVSSLRAAATQLYAGDLYASCDEEWLYFERERLRNVQIENLTALAHEAERSRDAVSAASYAQRLLAIDPWREEALRMLMRARMQTGDRAAALAEYERFRARLKVEIGVEPMSETASLYEAFSREEAPRAAETRRPAGIVGREGELDVLTRRAHAAAASNGGLVLVGGDAGVGKTALLDEFSAQCAGEGFLVLTAATPANETAPYAPFTEALATIGKTSPFSAEYRNAGQLFGAVAERLQTLSADRPVLLVAEDLHWATPDAIALLEFLARSARDQRLLIVGSYRESDIGAQHPLRNVRRIFNGRPWFAHVVIDALGRESAEQLVRRRLGNAYSDAQFQDLYARSYGNAFFLTELLEHVSGGTEDEIPSTIRSLVRERLASAGEEGRRLAELLAVGASALPREAIPEASGIPQESARELLARLCERRLIKEANARYEFVHEVVRQTVYDEIALDARAKMHRAVASAIRARHSADEVAALLSFHLELSGDGESAGAEYLKAARHAAAAFAQNDVENYARKALNLSSNATVGFEALVLLDDVYRKKGRPAERHSVITELTAIAGTTGKPADMLEALRRRIEYAAEGDVASMPQLIEHLAESAPDSAEWNARVHFFRGTYGFLEDAAERARVEFETARLLYAEAGDVAGELACDLRQLDLCDRHSWPYEEILERARQLAARNNDPNTTLLFDEAEAKLFVQRDRSVAEHAASRMLERAESTGDRESEALARTYLGVIASYRFDVEAAAEQFAAAQEIFESYPRRIEFARFLRLRGLFDYSTGDITGGLEKSLRSLELAKKQHAWELVAMAAGNAAYGYRLLGEIENAIALAEDALEQFQHLHGRYFNVQHLQMELSVEYCWRGEFERGLPVIERAYEEHALSGLRLHAGWMLTQLAFHLMRAGRIDDALRYVERYLELMPEMIDEGWMPQEGLWQAAQVLRAGGDDARAQMLLDRAAAVLARRSNALPDDESRRRYLSFPANREIMRAHTERVWPAAHRL